MSSWLINDATPESLGLLLVGGEFRSGAASHAKLESSLANFDAGTVFSYEQPVVIKRDGSVLFSGTVRELPRSGSATSEVQNFVVEDAWALLEKTTYQEKWVLYGTGYVYLPQVVLGLKADGTRIDVGQQIAEVIHFAADSGVAIQCGTMPTGLDLWPSEAVSQSCAEVIRTSLRYHPDWMAWIDHTTTPPTFNVTPRATATAVNLPVTLCSGVKIAERAELIPDCVRIIYACATTIDDTVYRDYYLDKYPTGGSEGTAGALVSAPGVLTTVIELAGGQASIAKQQIETVTIPSFDSGDWTADQAAWKAFFQTLRPDLKYVAAAGGLEAQGIRDTSWILTRYVMRLLIDDNTKPVEINPNATRLDLASLTDAPRVLVNGTIHEWMRKRSGPVCFKIDAAATVTADDREMKILRNLTEHLFTATGTNAETKIYKGQPQWKTVSESVPTGVAELYYNTIANGCRWEGSATLIDTSLNAMGWMGYCLNLTASADSDWATMKAPIHAISWDAQTEKCEISFGPNPHYSPQDFVEYLRLLRKRLPCWMDAAERTSPEMGCERAASAKNDHVGPAMLPQKETQPPPPAELPPFEVTIVKEGHPGALTYKAWVNHGRVLERRRATLATNMVFWEPDNIVVAGSGGDPEYFTRFTATVGSALYVKVTEGLAPNDVSAVTLLTNSITSLQSYEDGSGAYFYYKLAEFITLADGSTGIKPFMAGSHIYHWPEGKGLDLKIQTGSLNASGVFVSSGVGYDVTHYWRKGLYLGTTAPGTTADETQTIHSVA